MELLGEENVTSIIRMRRANRQTAPPLLRNCFRWLRFDSGKRHNGFAVCGSGNGGYPYCGTSVTDYIAAGAVNSNEKPGTNVTGVSDLGEIKAQVDVLLTFCEPDTKIAVVYCSAEPNSIYQAERAERYLKRLKRDCAIYTVADSNDVQAVLTKAVQECGAIFIPTDNTMANSMEIVKNITIPAGVPTFAGAEYMSRIGALATLSVRYYDLGVKAAEMAYNILVNGTKPAELPIAFVSDGVTPKYNAEIARALGITPPADMEALEETME